MLKRRQGLWRNTDFLKLWAGETISLFGSQITQLALPLVAVATLNASPFQMGMLSAAGTVPILLLSLLVGTWVDRQRRRHLLLLTDLGRALVLSSIPVAAMLNTLTMPVLYSVALLVGALSVVFDTAYQAYLPSLVQRDELVEGNGKFAISTSVAQVAGPATAGLLVTLFSAPRAIVLDAVSFVVSAICVLRIRRPEPPHVQHEHHPFLQDVRIGLQFVVQHPLLRTLVLATGLSNIASGAIFALQIVFMTRTLALSPITIGAILAVSGPSALLGALVVSKIVRPLGIGRTIVCGSALFTVGDVCLALAAGPPLLRVALLVLAQALIGVGSPLYNVTVISLRQTLTPDRLLGRVTASARMVAVGTLPLGALLGGTLGDRVGLRPTLLIAALWMLVPLGILARSAVGVLHEPPVASNAERVA